MNKVDDEEIQLESQGQASAESQDRAASEPQIARIRAEVTREVITQVSKYFSGPLPPPEILTEYNQAFPGAAERIVAMAESQLRHRQSLESKVVDSNCRNELAGMVIGAAVTLVAVIGGVYLAANDKPLSGFGVILTDLAVLAGIFVYSRTEQEKERTKKLAPFWRLFGRAPTNIPPPVEPSSN